MAKPKPHHGVAWRIVCDNDLEVVIVVASKCILLNSKEASGTAPWRLGYYTSPEDAQQKAVEMTGSYERLRAGKVSQPTPVILPEKEWTDTVDKGAVSERIATAIMTALDGDDLTLD